MLEPAGAPPIPRPVPRARRPIVMVVFGVTGGVGTGKSTVARMCKELGAVVLDADVMAHQAMAPRRLAWRQIVKRFGDDVLNEDGTIDRRALAAVVFSDAAARRALEAIVHPQVLRMMKQQLHRLRRRRGLPAVVLDVPLLLEAGMQELADVLVVVTAPAEAQHRRLRAAHGWTEEETAARIAAQWDVGAKAGLADEVIDNSGSVDATRTQVKQLWKQRVSRNKRSSTSRR